MRARIQAYAIARTRPQLDKAGIRGHVCLYSKEEDKREKRRERGGGGGGQVSPERVSMICARNEGSDAGGKSRFSMSRDNPYGIPRGSCGGEGEGGGGGRPAGRKRDSACVNASR